MNTPLTRVPPLASKKWAWWPILSGAYRASCAATARIPLPPPAQATRITAPHPVEIPHGIDSPVGRVYELDGQVLLLGIGHSSDTTIHLAELLAGVCYRRPKSVLVRQGEQIVRVDYGENDHCCQNFALADGWLDAKGLQRRGMVGHAGARLVRSRDIVETVVERLRAEETTFLHPYGVDEECDEARASIPS